MGFMVLPPPCKKMHIPPKSRILREQFTFKSVYELKWSGMPVSIHTVIRPDSPAEKSKLVNWGRERIYRINSPENLSSLRNTFIITIIAKKSKYFLKECRERPLPAVRRRTKMRVLGVGALGRRSRWRASRPQKTS